MHTPTSMRLAEEQGKGIPLQLSMVMSGILAVAFRGTETGTWVPGMSETGTNWDTNYDKELIDCNLGENACGHLHKGFSDLYQALQDDVVQAFNRAIAAHNPQKLLVTGHSLGAGYIYSRFHTPQTPHD